MAISELFDYLKILVGAKKDWLCVIRTRQDTNGHVFIVGNATQQQRGHRNSSLLLRIILQQSNKV